MSSTAIVPQATVEVRTAWASKINWTQMIGVIASVLVVATGGKLNIPIEQQASIVLLIQTGQGLITWVMKTWFTTTVTSSSVTATTSGPAA